MKAGDLCKVRMMSMFFYISSPIGAQIGKILFENSVVIFLEDSKELLNEVKILSNFGTGFVSKSALEKIQ